MVAALSESHEVRDDIVALEIAAHKCNCRDPCRLVRQVKKIPWLDRATGRESGPCHLAWQVNQILRHSSNSVIWPAL